MDRFCGSAFWDENVTWNTDDPDFTPCFEKTVLVWVPCILLWIFSPIDVYYSMHSTAKNIPWGILNVTKLAGSGILTFLSLVDLFHALFNFMEGVPVYPVNFFSPSLKIISFMLATVILATNRLRGIRSSGLLFWFWFFMVLLGAPQYRSEIRSYWNSNRDENRAVYSYVSYMIYYPILVAMLVLNFFADSAPTYLKYSEPENVCPESSASYPSKILFAWFEKFAWLGYSRPLENSDLWNLDFENTSESVSANFDKHWNEAIRKRTARSGGKMKYTKANGSVSGCVASEDVTPAKPVSIVPVICRTFGPMFMCGVFLKVIQDTMTFLNPQILGLLINFVGMKNGVREPAWRGFFYAGLLFAVAVVQTLLLSQYFHKMYIIGMRIRTALISLIYRKALKMSNTARRDFTSGEIVNLMAVDAQRFIELMAYINMIWSGPLQIFLAVFFLWQELGPSVLAGLSVMVIMIPLNGFVASKIRKLQIKQMKYKDDRVKLMNEILSGIKVLKLYAWEPSFEEQVNQIREKEIRILRHQAYLNAITSFIWSCAPFLVSLVTFAVYVLSDESHILTAETAFVSLSLFNILRFPLSMLPMMISNMVQSAVSARRINKFLNCDELNEDCVTHDPNEKDALVIENGTFTWGAENVPPVLSNINIRVKEGSLVAVVGTVGAGKSSLISALLGEMEKVNGYVNTKGSIAYVPQQAWIQNAKLRDNITFGDPVSQNFYNRVVNACALKPDLDMLPAGDLTEIGEKGINLSGGQKQRISLARAVYRNCDVYFLDDPLSAVDSHVGKHIFENVIGPTGLLKNKTRVLVTHSITYLSEVDLILVVKDGTITESGTYKELLAKKGTFAEFLITYIQEGIDDIENKDLQLDELEELLKETPEGEIGLRRRLKSGSSETQSNASTPQRQISIAEPADDKIVNGQKLIEAEHSETGTVKWKVYAYYLSSIGVGLCVGTLIMNMVFQAFSAASNIWLSIWTSDEEVVVNGVQDVGKRDMYLAIYGGLGILQACAVLVSYLLQTLGMLLASKHLHLTMLRHIMQSPLSFFDTTPLGRIINRFGKDIDTLDNTLPQITRAWMSCLFGVLTTLAVISYSTPIFTVVIVPIGLVYYFVQRFYVATSRQLKRLESISRSPIYSHFGETVSGVQSIRAYSMQSNFILESEKRVDFNQISYYPSIIANRWLAVRLETVGNLIILFAALFGVLGRDTLQAGLVGLSISYALQITQTLNWLVRMTSEVETNVVAVERIKEYGETPQEAAWKVETGEPAASWPSKGEIKVRDLKVRYRDNLDVVLKGLTFEIHGGEKVGLVGRTGSGKSSLTLSLFRIIEASEGKIFIDDVDIATIGLHTLRSKLTIIPQDPVLFSGTVRINLDPVGKYTDESLWRTLELSHLKTYIASLPGGLQHEVAEGGDNFSVGQRQLICLARALLRKTKVLILDEATAAVDLETDDLIQQTIRSEFSECTVLTIAHRLNTIMDTNRVIVLENGRIVEIGSPNSLVKNKTSLFYEMARDAGLA